MSKGKEFRGPKKRGFDDDGPTPYDAPTRASRHPRPGFGGSLGGPEMAPPVTGTPVDAIVKWFKSDKGFGFVELSNGTGDAFLHIGALQAAGFETVPPGAKLKVYVGTGAKGTQVTRVLEVDTAGAAERAPPRLNEARPPRRHPDPSTAVQVSGTVKWFDDNKGFGFVQSNDGGKDVFVHISILGPSGVPHLVEGQPVTMRVVDTPKGREALSIALA
ncbi:MAG TPA: cold shock domain-containing protein [Methylovirgula sp.]|nr:cold shock domain-containing protein [Methylovirgula sp.]